MPSKPTKAKQPSKTTPQSNPKEELANELNKAYGTVVGEFSDRLTEKEALEIAVEALEGITQGWEMRLRELEDEEE